MKTQNKLLIATLTATVFAGSAYAGGHNAGRHTYRDSAKVIDVTPIYRQIEVSTPREECWQEQVTYEAPAGRSSATPVILGSIIGGVIGNQIGDGRGRKIATVAGTLLGASIGADNAHANTRYAPTTATEQLPRGAGELHGTTHDWLSGQSTAIAVKSSRPAWIAIRATVSRWRSRSLRSSEYAGFPPCAWVAVSCPKACGGHDRRPRATVGDPYVEIST
ncbi:MAG: glycine zipper 2TM domain-containing protein [Pseudomonadota bacterium]|nr:MAG: glycine zipper 2TM domain-containing protein [Pseudomonadota bacterium]